MQKNYNRFSKLKLFKKKEKEKKWKNKEKKEAREENSTELQKPMQRQRFITTTEHVTEYTPIHIHL